jgi:hypothetical protein
VHLVLMINNSITSIINDTLSTTMHDIVDVGEARDGARLCHIDKIS